MKQRLWAFLFGFLIVTFVIWMKYPFGKQETFTSDNTATSSPAPFTYRENWMKNVAATNALQIYLSSSSDIQYRYNTAEYDSSKNIWRNFMATNTTDNDAFHILKDSTVVLNPIVNTDTGVSLGFLTEDVTLEGPYSYRLSPSAQTSGGGWTMPSFTMMTNLKLNTFTERVELFKIHADSPYQIEGHIDYYKDDLTDEIIDRNQLDIVFTFGGSDYKRIVPKGTLVYADSRGIFLTFVYNITENKVYIYVGTGDTTPGETLSVKDRRPIPITGDNMEINSDKKMDAKLYNLLYFTKALSTSEIDEVQTALLNELNGSSRAIAKAAHINTQETTTLQETITTLQNQLQTCIPSETGEAQPATYFQINPLGIGGLSAADVKACSAFNLIKHPLLSSSNDIGKLSFTARPSVIPTWIQYPDSITTDTQSQVPKETTGEVPRFLASTPPASTKTTTSSSNSTTEATAPSTGTTAPKTTTQPATILGTNTRRAEMGISTANPIQVVNPATLEGASYDQQRAAILGQENTSQPLPTVLPSPSTGTSTNSTSSDPTSTSSVFLGNFFDSIQNTFKLFKL